MNMNGMARAYMARNLRIEDFLIHVAKVTERQLKEWDDEYEVILMKIANYELIIKKDEKDYLVNLSETGLHRLQKKDPFALDRKIWRELEKQGLPIMRGFGNYMDLVLKPV
jgi:hypothetical protein